MARAAYGIDAMKSGFILCKAEGCCCDFAGFTTASRQPHAFRAGEEGMKYLIGGSSSSSTNARRSSPCLPRPAIALPPRRFNYSSPLRSSAASRRSSRQRTTLDILQQLVCRRYHHAPGSPGMRLFELLCAFPAVEASFATLDGIGVWAAHGARDGPWHRPSGGRVAARLGGGPARTWDTARRLASLRVLLAGVAYCVRRERAPRGLVSEDARSHVGSVVSFGAGGTITTHGEHSLAVYILAGFLWFAGLLARGRVPLPAMLTLVTSLCRYTPAETGYVLTALSATQAVVLGGAIPTIVRALRSRGEGRGMGGGAAADQVDMHVALASYAVESAAYVLLAFTRRRATQLAAVVLVGCGSEYAPAVRSLVAASVATLKQGAINAPRECHVRLTRWLLLQGKRLCGALGLTTSHVQHPLCVGAMLAYPCAPSADPRHRTMREASPTVFFVQAEGAAVRGGDATSEWKPKGTGNTAFITEKTGLILVSHKHCQSRYAKAN
ncbi:hypothetical protein GGX14DRAFT_629263 [Mycena pura]|uniref:Uncharacterized protein n=1 Tax=Mycena pura TaxID=153505 RepID=A0AAD7E4N0_9AGAR|nr:hypothetical protein GGX14DRAFT_629263 [Mycena pura]